MALKWHLPTRNAETAHELLHGIEIEDPFRWLEDQDAPRTRAFIQTEQQIHRRYLDLHARLRSRIERRVAELLTVEAVDLPVPDRCGGLIYLKREANQEQKAIFRQKGGEAEELLLSVETLRRDVFTSLSIIQISTDGRFLVFGIRTGGEDAQEIGIYDLKGGQLLPDRLPPGLYRGLVFDPNGDGFFYVHEETDGSYLHRRAVRRHAFDTLASRDCEIFHAGDGPAVRLILQAAEDLSGLGYIIVSLESVARARFLFHAFPLSAPPRELLHLAHASFGVRFSSIALEAITTYRAPHGRVVRISPTHPEPDAWIEVIAEKNEELYRWEQWGELWVLHYMANSQNRTRVYAKSGEHLKTIDYPNSGTTMLGKVDGQNNRLFYLHCDVCDAPAIYTVDLVTARHALWWRQPGFPHKNPARADCSIYRSKDGTRIPLTLFRQQSAGRQGPVVLCAYGGGGACATSKYSALVAVLLDAGIAFAIAHVRGGGEGGLTWRLAAHKRRKQTSVDDLIAGAEWLIEQGFTTSNQLGIVGQSAGGLLVLGALTQKPSLFRAVLALGPLTDLTRFHFFGVGRGFVAELGSPDDPDDFAALYRLSPYHHIRVGAVYPAVLIVSGDRDKRCDALHARKIIARLRSVESSANPVLLDYTETRGHKPVLPLSERIRSLTDRLTFLIAELRGELPEEYSL